LEKAMRRRGFIKAIASSSVAWPLAALGQQPAKLPTIGFFCQSTRSAASEWVAAFVQRLRELGWIENRTVAIDYRWVEGREERFAEVRPAQGRCHCHIGNPGSLGFKAGDIRYPDHFRDGRGPG
jgi:hypothetical protein